MSARFDAIRAAIEEVERLALALDLTFEEDLPEDIRDKLLVLGSSFHDYVLWVRRRPQADDLSNRPEDQMYWASEMEAGTGAWGVTARDALERYFRDDLLDHRGPPVGSVAEQPPPEKT